MMMMMEEDDSDALESPGMAAVRDKLGETTAVLTADPRFDLHDELLIQVLGFTLLGYAVGFGLNVSIIEPEEAAVAVESCLVELGVGPGYVQGMLANAVSIWLDEENQSLHKKLLLSGYQHWATETAQTMADQVFANLAAIPRR